MLRENLPGVASLENPVDYAAGFHQQTPTHRALSARASMRYWPIPTCIRSVVLLATSTGRAMYNGAAGVAEALKKTDKPVLLFCSIPYEAAPEGFDVIAAEKIPMQPSPRRVAYAMGRLADYCRYVAAGVNASHIRLSRVPRALPALPAGARDAGRA